MKTIVGTVVLHNTGTSAGLPPVQHNKQYTLEVTIEDNGDTLLTASWGRIGANASKSRQVKDTIKNGARTFSATRSLKEVMNKLTRSKMVKGYCLHERWWEEDGRDDLGGPPWKPERVVSPRAQAETNQRRAVAESVASRQLTAEW